eukprot:TRINITY_DN2393_c0_g1_i4.p1 TRINITY_DN2393_c0_g1~~TRINITY_DN2393_c0_g1_i4.p1  ORF type:complete len:263 (-),score=45.00 TRINITY_DN2393_c0_g1_i4:692-1480(-)
MCIRDRYQRRVRGTGSATMENQSIADVTIGFSEPQPAVDLNDEDVESAWALLNTLAPSDLVETFTSFSHTEPDNLSSVFALQPAPVVDEGDVKKKRPRATAEELGRKLTRREANTLCEARRREKLNECIQELARLAQLPFKSTNKDKCTVLSHVAAVLRTRKLLNDKLDEAVQNNLSSLIHKDNWNAQPLGMFILSLQMKILDANVAVLTRLGYGTDVDVSDLGNGMTFAHPDFAGQATRAPFPSTFFDVFSNPNPNLPRCT